MGPVVAGVLAHQGGWDEALFVAAPVVVIAGLLVLANRRANALAAREEQAAPGDVPDERGGASDPLDVDADRP